MSRKYNFCLLVLRTFNPRNKTDGSILSESSVAPLEARGAHTRHANVNPSLDRNKLLLCQVLAFFLGGYSILHSPDTFYTMLLEATTLRAIGSW